MVVFAGAHLHHLLWPAAYQSVLTSANVLRSASAAILAVGGLVELRRVAAERTSLLKSERAYSARLAELAALKADFNAIVAHELGTPVAAISRLADALATGELDAKRQADVLDAFRSEVALLEKLAADVTAAARDEREDFDVKPQPTPVADLLAGAAAVAKALPGNHPLTVEAPRGVQVYADPVRIGQVLRNLLCNAAKYSPPGTPITLCARVGPKRVRIEVVDRGTGIHPADLDRIFRKFGRGRNTDGQRVPGLGLGLYLSRRIVRMHGGELTVSSRPGAGSTFGFELEAVR
jgi:signal transduction histidine kinase